MGSQHRAVAYLSASMPVNMGNWWFDESVTIFGFEVVFEVMRRLADSVSRNASCAAGIGCGQWITSTGSRGLYGIPVAGFELNVVALQKNVGRLGPLYCYNIHQRNRYIRGMRDVGWISADWCSNRTRSSPRGPH